MKRLLHGVDVSNWQGAVDWGAHAAAGVSFAFAKASEGTTYVDRWFGRNWRGMRANRILCGAYHFGRPAGDPVDQARHFLRVLRAAGGLRRGDLVALDLETSDDQPPEKVSRFALQWCAYIERRCRMRPMIYTFHTFARRGHCEGLGRYPLWIAGPGRPRGRPLVPGPWRDWTIHQYAQRPIDRNIFLGSRRELMSLGFDAPRAGRRDRR
ncbi:glycoside hydrolase family 25 protein [Sinosporangium album]|uniref:glycoside hydrolase family 25 protein n=1 Tax=Sinosporangium album TaxID=504805 RepID=UPI0015A29544|nr:glycoside hydrolase family 25 protein [Sinosporangium album]